MKTEENIIEENEVLAEAKMIINEDDSKKVPKLEAKDLTAYYGDFKALKDINLTIKANQIHAFIGPSGCGKSTFLRSFNRMNDYIEGFRIDGGLFYDGGSLYDKNIKLEQLRKDIGMVFQKPNPFPKTIFENVAFGLRIQGIRDKEYIQHRVEESLKQVVLWDEVKDELNKSALALSGGQQQRVCMARTMAVQPSVILMDEPTSALDPISTAHIEDLLGELKKEYTIVIVTHNLQQAGRISDFTSFFYMGELIESGKTNKIFTKPKEKQTENYITGRFG